MMRILLTGATGFVGSEVLNQLLDDPSITLVTCLTRRPLASNAAKLITIFHEDFATYRETLARQLADHTACIWALGGKASDIRTEYERVTHTFTIHCAQALASHVRAKFAFCYLSGMGADPSESSRIPWERLTRNLKGRTEKDLEKITQQYPLFAARSFRPGGILPRNSNRLAKSLFGMASIGVEDLARAMILEATQTEPTGYRLISNAMIKGIARGAQVAV